MTEVPAAKKARVADEKLAVSGGIAYPDAFVSLWRAGSFCDLTIELDDGTKLAADTKVLAAGSEYMATALQQKHFAEGATHRVCEMHSACFTACLEFLYTGAATIASDLIVQLLEAANRLRIASLAEAVASAIHKCKLGASSAVVIWECAQRYEAPSLEKAARLTCLRHFGAIATHPTLVDLTADQLKALLSDDALQVPSERVACDALLRWATHHQASAEHFTTMLSLLRFGSMSPDDLRYLREHPLVSTRLDALHTLSEGLIAAREEGSAQAKPRNTTMGVAYLVGGRLARFGLAPPCMYCPETNAFVPLAPLPRYQDGTKDECRAAALAGCVYALGGRMHRYDAVEDSWHEVGSMHEGREGFAVAVLDGKLYAAGGSDDTGEDLKSVERYDPQSDKWEAVTSMPTARKHLGLVAFEGHLFAIGGSLHDDIGAEVKTDKVERYDPKANCWYDEESLNLARDGLATVVYADMIWAIGGATRDPVHDSDRPCATVEVLQAVGGEWSYDRRAENYLPVALDGLMATVISRAEDDELWIFGGSSSSGAGGVTSTVLKVNAWDARDSVTPPHSMLSLPPQWLGSCCSA